MGAVNVLVGEKRRGQIDLDEGDRRWSKTLTLGQIDIDGQPVTIRTKEDAVANGIGIVLSGTESVFPR